MIYYRDLHRYLARDLDRASNPAYYPTSNDWKWYESHPALRNLRWTSGQSLTIDLIKLDKRLQNIVMTINSPCGGISRVHLIDLPELYFNGAMMELLVLLRDLVESGWLESAPRSISLLDLQCFEKEKAQAQLLRYFPSCFYDSFNTKTANCVYWSYTQMSECIPDEKIRAEKSGNLMEFIHILVRFPQETIFVEYFDSEQDYMRVGVMTRDE